MTPDSEAADLAPFDTKAWLEARRTALFLAMGSSHLAEWLVRVLDSRRTKPPIAPAWVAFLASDVGVALAILFPEELLPLLRYVEAVPVRKASVLLGGTLASLGGRFVAKRLIDAGRPRAGYVTYLMCGIAGSAIMRVMRSTVSQADESARAKEAIGAELRSIAGRAIERIKRPRGD